MISAYVVVSLSSLHIQPVILWEHWKCNAVVYFRVVVVVVVVVGKPKSGVKLNQNQNQNHVCSSFEIQWTMVGDEHSFIQFALCIFFVYLLLLFPILFGDIFGTHLRVIHKKYRFHGDYSQLSTPYFVLFNELAYSGLK